MNVLLTILATSLIGQVALAQELSNKALFHRCYRQITQSFPDPGHPLLAQVNSGQLDPITACLQVLDKARFTANNNRRIGNVNDQEAKNVLRTLHAAHNSWLSQKSTPSESVSGLTESENILDFNGPALFFTRALFAPGYNFRDVFLGTGHLESDRTDNNPPRGPVNNRIKADYGDVPGLVLAAIGDLRGVRTYTTKRYNYVESDGDARVAVYDTHMGSGVLGSASYINNNIDVGSNYRANGTTLMHRKWSRNLTEDYLCRTLPVVRYADAQPSLEPNSSIAFRQQLACVACHVTIDPMAAGHVRTIRGASSTPNDGRRLAYYNEHTISQGDANYFPTSNDGNFYRRPIRGHFMFRTHNGQLVNENLNGGDSLGQAITGIDAPYICAAKRYYKYFTGVNANVDDIADPQYPRTLSDNEVAHRNEVIALGQSLRQHQSLRTLVENILRTPQFKNSGYNLSN